MKVVLLQKKLSTSVIAWLPQDAIDMLLAQDECKDYTVSGLQMRENPLPNAYQQTMEFVKASGTYVLGSEIPADEGGAPRVWDITIDLESVIDFTAKPQEPNKDDVLEGPPSGPKLHVDDEGPAITDPNDKPVESTIPGVADLPG